VDQATRPVIDMGWDDFAPSTPKMWPRAASGIAGCAARLSLRSIEWTRQVLRFAVFTLLARRARRRRLVLRGPAES